MKKTFKLSALLLVLITTFTLTACNNSSAWSMEGVAEEIKFNGEKVILPLSLDDFGEKYTITDETEHEFLEGESMKIARISYDGSVFADVMMRAYNNKEFDNSRPIFFYDIVNYTISDNSDGPNQTTPPDISINGLTFSSTVDDVKKVMGDPTEIDGIEYFIYSDNNSSENPERNIEFFFDSDGKMISILIYFSPEITYAFDYE